MIENFLFLWVQLMVEFFLVEIFFYYLIVMGFEFAIDGGDGLGRI